MVNGIGVDIVVRIVVVTVVRYCGLVYVVMVVTIFVRVAVLLL